VKVEIGVMQGRLLPKYRGRYQAHPLGYWRDEFLVAKGLGLTFIEFILDFDDAGTNPLLSQNGRSEILEQVTATGVRVKTICADYFMEAPLHSADSTVAAASLKVLQRLLVRAAEVGASDVVIPCVDRASLRDSHMVDNFVNSVRPLLGMLDELNINLALETDLNPADFTALLERFDSLRVTVNYDTGNSAALGYDPVEELAAYGDKITDIHIKDRVLGGGPVLLGTGNADFERFFTKLKELDYQGPFIMQAYRDDEGVKVFKEQLAWIRECMDDWYAR
jgi:sugar phosphate isomerase/epimerase